MKLTFCRSSFILSAASCLAPARKPERSVIIPGRAPDLPGERGEICIVYWLISGPRVGAVTYSAVEVVE